MAQERAHVEKRFKPLNWGFFVPEERVSMMNGDWLSAIGLMAVVGGIYHEIKERGDSSHESQ